MHQSSQKNGYAHDKENGSSGKSNGLGVFAGVSVATLMIAISIYFVYKFYYKKNRNAT
jgi:hypothetical protein